MSPARIKRRTLGDRCPVCGKTTHLQVVFRMGGRGYPELAAGTFHYSKDARARRDFVAGEIAAGRDPRATLRALSAPRPPVRDLEQTIAGYEASRIDFAAETAKNARSHLKRAVEFFSADRDPLTITVTESIDYVSWLAADLKPSSVSRYMATFRLLLDYAGADPNPARDPRVKLPSIEHAELEPPSGGHVVAILERIPDRWVLPLITIEQTAMAIGETSQLEWGDVDEQGCRFRLRRATVKGQIRSRARWVQVPDWLMEIIASTCPPEDRTPTRRVFQGVTPDAAKNAMARACGFAGIPVYSPHDLRHRRLSLWHGQGVPAKELAGRAGHAKASMTLDVYSHVMPLDEVPVGTLAALARGRKR